MGKSRTVAEVAKSRFTFPFCLREDGKTSYEYCASLTGRSPDREPKS